MVTHYQIPSKSERRRPANWQDVKRRLLAACERELDEADRRITLAQQSTHLPEHWQEQKVKAAWVQWEGIAARIDILKEIDLPVFWLRLRHRTASELLLTFCPECRAAVPLSRYEQFVADGCQCARCAHPEVAQ